jgi:tetratricopeptide (TPR) repeat protein
MRALAAITGKPVPTTAKQAVEEGLAAFNERKDYNEALRLFKAAMELKPNDEEAIAALYNAGCAHAKRKEWREASEAILSAVNEYNLKLSVALQVWGTAEGPAGARFVWRARCAALPLLHAWPMPATGGPSRQPSPP